MGILVSNTVFIIGVLVDSTLSLVFCIFALFVLVYYIRRRYKLYKEINRIPQELLILESYMNHLKNLKLTCIINNFIIIILVIEFIQYLSQFFMYIPSISYFVKEPEFNFHFLLEYNIYFSLFYITMSYLIIPVLSMMMDFLWLALGNMNINIL